MKRINGNTVATIQKILSIKNEYGEQEKSYVDILKLKGFLDLQSGNAEYNYNSKITESTHVFVSDYQKLNVSSEHTRMVIDGNTYEIMYIDNPMELNYHLEFYLKFIGGEQS